MIWMLYVLFKSLYGKTLQLYHISEELMLINLGVIFITVLFYMHKNSF